MARRQFRNLPAVRDNKPSKSLTETVNKVSENSSIAVYDVVSGTGRAVALTHGAITGRNRLKKAFYEANYGSDLSYKFGPARVIPGIITGAVAGMTELLNLMLHSANTYRDDSFMAIGAAAGVWAAANIAYLQLHSLYNTGKLLKPKREQQRLTHTAHHRH